LGEVAGEGFEAVFSFLRSQNEGKNRYLGLHFVLYFPLLFFSRPI